MAVPSPPAGGASLLAAVRVLTLGIQTRHSRSIRLHVHLNILETCQLTCICVAVPLNAKITLSLLSLRFLLVK